MIVGSPVSPFHLNTEAEPASETFLLSRERQCPNMGNDYESVIQELLELSDVIPLYQRCGGDY